MLPITVEITDELAMLLLELARRSIDDTAEVVSIWERMILAPCHIPDNAPTEELVECLAREKVLLEGFFLRINKAFLLRDGQAQS